jgi:hypothetical protein
MSDTSSLTELARFVGRSNLASGDAAARRHAVTALAARMAPARRRNLTEVLGAVLALSARTRRMLMPRVGIDLDVFTPDGSRAVRVVLPQR